MAWPGRRLSPQVLARYQTVQLTNPSLRVALPAYDTSSRCRAARSQVVTVLPSLTLRSPMDNNGSGSGVKKQEDMDGNDPKAASKETKPPVRTLNRVPRTIRLSFTLTTC